MTPDAHMANLREQLINIQTDLYNARDAFRCDQIELINHALVSALHKAFDMHDAIDAAEFALRQTDLFK